MTVWRFSDLSEDASVTSCTGNAKVHNKLVQFIINICIELSRAYISFSLRLQLQSLLGVYSINVTIDGVDWVRRISQRQFYC